MKKLIFLLALVFIFSNANAQWTHTGPTAKGPGNYYDLDSFSLTLTSFGIYKTYDNTNWDIIPQSPCVLAGALVALGSTLIVNSDAGFYKSIDYGQTWVLSNNGFSVNATILPREKSLVALSNGKIFSSFSQVNLYQSIDTAQSWQLNNVFSGDVNNLLWEPQSQTLALATTNGVFASFDEGVNWVQKINGLSNLNLKGIFFSNGIWFCVTVSNTIYHALDTSFNWSPVPGLMGSYINPSFVEIDGQLLGNRTTGVMKYNYLTNQFENSSINQTQLMAITTGNDSIIFGFPIVSGRGWNLDPQFSIDEGLNWAPLEKFLFGVTRGFNKSDLFFLSGPGAAYLNQWNNFQFLFDEPFELGTISGENSNTTLLKNGLYYASTSSGIWISNDSAQTWVQHTTGLPQTPPSNYFFTYDLEVFGDTVIVSTDMGPYISTNGGNSFSIANFQGTTSSKDLLYHNNKLYSAGSPKILVSSDLGANWVQFGNTTNGFLQMVAAGPYIYSATDQSIHMTIDTIGITMDVTGTLDLYIGQGNNPGIAAYDSLLFVSNFYKVGVQKMNVNQPGVYSDISDNLPVYELTPGNYRYTYMDGSCNMTIFDNKLWLGTAGMSCFTRPLSDFGYPPVVTENKKVEVEGKMEEGLRVYPNPSYNELNLQYSFDGESVVTLLISDLSGRLVQQQRLAVSSGISSINIKDLPEGMYLLELFDQKGNSKKTKFVKQ